ncbi:MAG: ATP-binding protein [Legionella sp.]|nr:ATP-binding protein [Legionella sp.]
MKNLIDIPELYYHLLQQINPSKAHGFLNPPPAPVIQRGECCKLYAVHSVMQWLYKTDPSHPEPPLTRKKDSEFGNRKASLRSQAKHSFHSQVGEIYDSNQLLELTKENGFDRSVLLDKPEKYATCIVQTIDQGFAPVVFFDLDFDTWGPGLYNSKHEHAAVILGYYYDKQDELCFVSTYWNSYFYFKAEALTSSTAQLALERIPETFYKVNGSWLSNQGRHRITNNEQLPMREGRKSQTINATFRHKVLKVCKSETLISRSQFVIASLDSVKPVNAPQFSAHIPTRTYTDSLFLRTPDSSRVFYPLATLISFFTTQLLLSRHTRLTEQTFTDYFSADFSHQLTTFFSEHAPSIDMSLEGDIYNQSESPERSLVEEVSNSIDAEPEEIHCTIREGFYEVCEVAGQGMSPLVVCTKYILPKETTKRNSPKSIGYFGLGSLNKLSHLRTEDDCIIVKTKAEGHIGCRLEYRIVNGCLSVALSEDETIETGTITEVYSSMVKPVTFEAFLRRSISEELTVPVYINKERFIPQKNSHSISIYKANILIQQITHPLESFTTQLEWHLSSAAKLGEGRNRLLINNPTILNEIKQRILHIKDLPYPEWALYANTIGPMVEELQINNSSLYAEDNLVDILINITHDKLAHAPCVPDSPLYKPLLTEDVVPLHVSLLPMNWIQRSASTITEFEQNTTKILAASMAYQPEGQPFLYDAERNTVFVDHAFYEEMKANQNMKLLALLLSYPPKESSIKLAMPQSSVALSQDGTYEFNFNEEAIQHPLHDFYLRHGALSRYGDEAINQLLANHPQVREILSKAPTVVAAYPQQSFKRSLPTDYLNQIDEKLIPISFRGEHYYFMKGTNKSALLDRYFQVLKHHQWELLIARIKRIIKTHRVEKDATLDITLTEDDLFVLRDAATQMYYLSNGLGERQFPELTSVSLILHPVDNVYYILRIKQDCYLLHRQDGIIMALNNWAKEYKFLPDLPHILVEHMHDYDGKALHDIRTKKALFPDCNYLLMNSRFVLGITPCDQYPCHLKLLLSDIEKSFQISLRLDDYAILSKYSYPAYFHCEQISEFTMNLSVISRLGIVHFFKINIQENCWGYTKPQKTLGYPVRALYIEEQQHGSIISVEATPQIILSNCSLKSSYQNKSNQYLSLDDHYLSLAKLKPDPHILFQQGNQFGLLDTETLTTCFLSIPVDIPINLQKTKIQKKSCYYQIRNQSTEMLFDREGQLLHHGKSVNTEESSIGLYVFKDKIVFSPSGNQLNSRPASWFYIVNSFRGEIICIVLESESQECELYNLQDQRIHHEETITTFYQNKKDSFYEINRLTITPYGTTPHYLSNAKHYASDKTCQVYNLMSAIREKWLITRGYSIFPEALLNDSYLLGDNVFETKGTKNIPHPVLLQPLSLHQLQDPIVLSNLEYLNQMSLSVGQYSECLRFVDWPPAQFCKIVPHVRTLTHTPGEKFRDDYLMIIHFAEKLSARDEALVLGVFNLSYLAAHEILEELVTPKIMNVIEFHGMLALNNFYQSLKSTYIDIAYQPDSPMLREFFNKMPEITGQIAFYVFFPEHQLLAAHQNSLAREQYDHQVSLIQFITAYQLNRNILENVEIHPHAFIETVEDLANSAEQSHALRILQHAIYHQTDPHQNLYQRELLQNALDAYSESGASGEEALIDIALYSEERECVLTIQDNAKGMSLLDVFYFFMLVGTSSKRDDRHARFIGGHGVGVFTIYHQAKTVRLKSGNGDNNTAYFAFTPVYDSENMITDVIVQWSQVNDEPFHGVTLERVARGGCLALEAARHHRSLKKHAKTVDANCAVIQLNQNRLNNPLQSLAKVTLPGLGELTLFDGVEDELAAGGLAIKPLTDMDNFIPEGIRKMVRKKGIIINLPKAFPLTRARNELLNAQKTYSYLRPFLLQAYIQAYIQQVMSHQISVHELPYDFFIHFERYAKHAPNENPELLLDVERIKQNLPLEHYEKYADLGRLHALLAFLPLFTVKKSSIKSCSVVKEQYSLMELAEYYHQFKAFPDLDVLPLCLLFFAKKMEHHKLAQTMQKEIAQQLIKAPDFSSLIENSTCPLKAFPVMDWSSSAPPEDGSWAFLLKVSELIAELMGQQIQFGFTTAQNGGLAHTKKGAEVVHWNVYSVQQTLGEKLYEQLSSQKLSRDVLTLLLDTISHELTHAKLEAPCGTTHNRSFYILQRKLLVHLTYQINEEELTSKIVSLFNEYKPKMTSAKPFQADCLIEETFFKDRESVLSRKFFEIFTDIALAQEDEYPGLRMG